MSQDIQRCWLPHVPWAWHAVLPRPLGVSFFQLKSLLSFLLSEIIGGVSLPLSVVLLFLDYYSYLSLVVRIPLLLYLGKFQTLYVHNLSIVRLFIGFECYVVAKLEKKFEQFCYQLVLLELFQIRSFQLRKFHSYNFQL